MEYPSSILELEGLVVPPSPLSTPPSSPSSPRRRRTLLPQLSSLSTSSSSTTKTMLSLSMMPSSSTSLVPPPLWKPTDATSSLSSQEETSSMTSSKSKTSSVSTSFSKKVISVTLFGICMCFGIVTKSLQCGKFEFQYQHLLNRIHKSRKLRKHSHPQSYNLLSPAPRQLSELSIRYLILGGPSSGGQGLQNVQDAYPYLLSSETISSLSDPNTHNYAQATTFSSSTTQDSVIKQQQIMTSLCTQSIVGDQNMYDVIVLEYQSYDKSSLTALVQRLRQRFPTAIIVFVQLWTPLDLYYYQESNVDNGNGNSNKVKTVVVSFEEWQKKQSESLISMNDLVIAMKEHSWLIRDQHNDLESIIQSVEGGIVLYQLPVPLDDNTDDSLPNMVQDWFIEDNSNISKACCYTLSSTAHIMVAHDIQSLLSQPEILKWQQQHHTMEIGTWGVGDSCQLWYESGNGLPTQYSRGLRHEEISFVANKKYHALEVEQSTGGTIEVSNPFEQDRMLYLTYMVTSATASYKKVYPRTKVQLQPIGQETNNVLTSHIVLDPSHDDNTDVSHRTRTTAVGIIPAKRTVQVNLIPLEDHTLHKFRLVGMSFLAHNIQSEYAMSSSEVGGFVELDDTDSMDDEEDENLDKTVFESEGDPNNR